LYIRKFPAEDYWVGPVNVLGSVTIPLVSEDPAGEEYAEGFEGETFPPAGGWTTSGAANWTRTTDDSHTGSACATSGAVSGDDISVLEYSFTLWRDATFSFWRKWSRVGDYSPFPGLKTYINGGVGQDDAIVYDSDDFADWTQLSVDLSPGVYTVRWEFSSAGAIEDGDQVWIDDVSITFP
jgi:hypothetical protein